jgi:nuclear pore complex protein Nup160
VRNPARDGARDVVDADAGVRASADDWRASKRHRGEGGETPSDGARGARGGGVVDSKTGDVIAWNVGGEFGGDVCVIKSTRGWAVRVVTPSALAPSCACASDGERVDVVLATADGAFVVRVRVRLDGDFDDDGSYEAIVGRAPSSMSGVQRIGACGAAAAILCDASGCAIVRTDRLTTVCELQTSTLSRVWNTIKGSSGQAVVDVTPRCVRVGAKDLVATLSSDGFVQVWDVTNAIHASQARTTDGSLKPATAKVSRVCGSHLPPAPGTKTPAPDRVATSFACAPSAKGLTLNVVVSSRLAPVEADDEAAAATTTIETAADAATLAFYTVKHGALAFGSSIEGSKGVARALALTPDSVVAALENFDDDDASSTSTSTLLSWPLDALHRARDLRCGDVEANVLAEWGHAGRGNGAAVELLRRFGKLNGYTAASVANSLASEIALRGLSSELALQNTCDELGLDEAKTASDALVAAAGANASIQRVVETWCRVAPTYAREWSRAHAPMAFLLDTDASWSSSLVLLRAGDALGAIRAGDDVEESLLRAQITNEDSPMLNFSGGKRQVVSALTALFARLNSVLGSSACSAMDLIAGGLCVDTSTSSKATAFDNYDENIEASSHTTKDWLESFAGVLIGDVFPAVQSDETETQAKSRKASRRAKQRIVIRLLQDALSTLAEPAQALRERVDEWTLPSEGRSLGAVDDEASEMDESQFVALVLNATKQQTRARVEVSRGLVLLLGCIRLGPKIGFAADAADSITNALPAAMSAYRSAILSSWLLTERRSSLSINREDPPRLAVTLANLEHPDILECSSSVGDRLRSAGTLVASALDASDDEPSSHTRRVIEIGTTLYASGEVDALGTLLAFARQQVPGSESVAKAPFDAPAPLFLQALWTCADLVGLNQTDDANAERNASIDSAIALFSRAAAFVPEVAGPVDSLLVQLLRVIQSILMGTDDAAFPNDVVSRLEYYEIVMLFFERLGCAPGAQAAAYAALHEVRDDENQSARLWANALQYATDAGDWRAAYCAAASTAGEHRQAAAMRRLVASVCERGAKNGGAVLSTLCLDESERTHYDTIINALEGRASTAPVDSQPSPSEILYGFYLSRGDPAKAAVSMHEYANRLSEHTIEIARKPDVTYDELVDALARHASAALSSANALAMVSDPCSVSFETVVEDEHMEGNDDVSSVNVVSSGLDTKKSPLATVTREYVLSAARLELLHVGCETAMLHVDSEPRKVIQDLVQSLIAYGCFAAAKTLCTAWLDGEKLTSSLALIAGAMAARASMAQVGDASVLQAEQDAALKRWNARASDLQAIAGLIGVEAPVTSVDTYWNELRAFVERFDAPERNFALSEATARSILAVNAKLALPSWLIKRFVNPTALFSGGGMARRGADPAALLRIYLAFNRAEDAAQLALKELSFWAKRSAIDRTAHAACWFPMDLIFDARDRCANDDSLQQLCDALSAAISSHEARLKTDTQMLAQAA